jgi:hypothetical protein
MLRRLLVLGIGLVALLGMLAPSPLQAQHGGRGGGSRSSFAGVRGTVTRSVSFSRFGGFNRGFDGRFSSFGFGRFNRGFDGRFSGFGFGGFGSSFFYSPGFGGYGLGYTTPVFPPTDPFGRPLFLPGFGRF